MNGYSVDIKDANLLKTQANDLYQLVNSINEQKEALTTCVKNISQAWEGNGDDRLSYLTHVENNIENIGHLSAAIKSLAQELEFHAQAIINQANSN